MNLVMKRILCLLLAVAPAVAHADKNFTSGKGTTWDCKKDPKVNISHGKGVYTFKGACTQINLSGGKSKLTIESVDQLNVSSAGNTIMVGTLGAAGTWFELSTPAFRVPAAAAALFTSP